MLDREIGNKKGKGYSFYQLQNRQYTRWLSRQISSQLERQVSTKSHQYCNEFKAAATGDLSRLIQFSISIVWIWIDQAHEQNITTTSKRKDEEILFLDGSRCYIMYCNEYKESTMGRLLKAFYIRHKDNFCDITSHPSM